MGYSRKISNPSISVEEYNYEGNKVEFLERTLLFYSKKYLLGELDEESIKTKEINAGSKLSVNKTLYREQDDIYISRTVHGMWFEWTKDEAVLLYEE